MASVSASVFGAVFNDVHNRFVRKSPLSAKFDARVFVMPNISEVTNYLIWRQQDATRNSIQQYGRSQFSHRELEFKSCDEIQEMLFQKAGFNWNSAVPWTKRGFVVTKAATDWIIPKFTEDRTYIETLYNPINEEQTDNS